MNKRQRKKKWKKETPEEFRICQGCGKGLNPSKTYHMKFGACNVDCKLHSVGMSWSDFY